MQPLSPCIYYIKKWAYYKSCNAVSGYAIITKEMSKITDRGTGKCIFGISRKWEDERSRPMEKSDFQNEVEYLGKVEGIIRNRLERLCGEKASLKSQVVQERKDMWDDNRHVIRDFDDVILLSSQEAAVKLTEAQYQRNETEIRRLRKMESSPYFGRVDFTESETGENSTVYIGIFSLTEEESREIYVVDWRAPVSSMFYQFDLGPAWYQVNDYKNEVEMTGKKQYKIEEGRLLSVYDTNSSMYDDILGEVLSKQADHKLKVIVGSIQKEQNAAIRSDTKRSCLIYGLAGSGKTSIGLHRLAYVLYCNKDTVKAKNILILSNNSIFGSYISTILPDLGEEPAETKVFADLLEAYLDEGMEVEDYYRQLKVIEEGLAEERLKWIQIKYSADMLQHCIDYFASFPFQIPEIRYKEEILVSPGLLQSKLNVGRAPDFRSRCERLRHLVRKTIEDFFVLHREEICNDILTNDDDVLSAKEAKIVYKRTMQEYLQSAQNEITRLNRLDAQEQTKEVFADYLHHIGEDDEEAERLFYSLKRGKLLYEDALLYLLIRVLTGEAAPFPNIYHTVIDESQDYNLLQLYIVKSLFPGSSFTLLGDIWQTVNSVTTIQKYDTYEWIFGTDLVRIRLSKCYRSSSDINALAFRLISQADQSIEDEYSYFARTVRKPQYIISKDLFSCLAPILERLEKYASVAIIVNNDEEALAVKSCLQKDREVQMIISPDEEMKDRVVIIPLLLAKGLEFDAVILFNCIYPNVKSAHFRRKVYLGCTRALHELYFIERDVLPDSLQECAPYVEVSCQ